MLVGVVGLGYIGASFCKALKLKTEHHVLGYDKNNDINIKARMLKVVDDCLGYDNIGKCKILLLCLPPQNTVDYIENHHAMINPDTIVVDVCGVKQPICEKAFEIAEKSGFTFIGGHPITNGIKWGFENSRPSAFDNASMVLTPPANISIGDLDNVKSLIMRLGFTNMEICTPREHDRIIACTDQLPHIIAGAYIKSETAGLHYGLSADGYGNLSKNAEIDEKTWARLLSENREFLLYEIDCFTEQIQKYRDAIDSGDIKKLEQLIKEGRDIKQYIDGKNTAFRK